MAIFLFAGHSNADPGATGVRGRTEAVETIALREAVRRHFTAAYKVMIDDNRDSLSTVLAKAVTGSGSVVLDLHFNASASSDATGVEVLVGDDAQANDLALARDVLDVVVKATGLRSRGIKREGETPRKRLGVMRESGAVCLLEVCFISNPSDMAAYDAAIDTIAQNLALVLMRHDDRVK